MEFMDRFRELSTFVAVVEEGAFNGAARRLNASPPAVSRLVGALETRLGVQLLARTTRQMNLTEAGQRLYRDAVAILDELAAAEASTAGLHGAPQGVLRVTAPVLFGQRFVAPILREYLDLYPAVTAEVVFIDRVVNLIDEGLDVALRIGDLPDSSLYATHVGAVRRVTVAAPAYLAGAPTLREPGDLVHHRIIHPTGAGGGSAWEYVGPSGRHLARLAPVLRVNTMDAAIDAALAGWGVTRILSYQVGDALADGRLVEVLTAWEGRLMPIHLVHAEGARAAAKIRSFIDLAAARLRRESGRLEAR
jgi:DNA-binding transcriptional LysR family regulator